MDNREMRVRFVVGEREWELDAFDLDLDQAIALQKLTGRTWGDLCVSVDVADAEALKAMFWLARINAGEQVAYDDPSMSPKWRDFTFQILTKAEPPAK